MRTIVDLQPKQISALSEFCAKKKISRAEAIRRAVEAMLESQKISNRDSAFGAWKPSRNSRELIDQLRNEWE